jgi:hypothetical protein
MPAALEALRSAVDALDEDVDPKQLRQVIDRLEKKFSEIVFRAHQRGDHVIHGFGSTAGWIARDCGMTSTSVGDRLCVGEQIASMPKVADALESGDIGYQATSVICHLREKLGEKSGLLDEEQWIHNARTLSIKELRYASLFARHVWDPEGFERDDEEDYETRYLHLSEMGRMYRLDALLDPEGGAALKSALDVLVKRLGPDDRRTAKQRRADALVEMVQHAMDNGTLPRRNGVRPHVNVTTTVEALTGEAGSPASELEGGMPVSSKTAQRLACSGTLTRVVKAGSVVVDVGRATRAVSPSQWRALKARHAGCGWTGCDRPIGWTNAHHIQFWAKGGPSNASNLLPLCYFHHRLVHEGGWQVIRAGDAVRFIPPDRIQARLARSPGAAAAA